MYFFVPLFAFHPAINKCDSWCQEWDGNGHKSHKAARRAAADGYYPHRTAADGYYPHRTAADGYYPHRTAGARPVPRVTLRRFSPAGLVKKHPVISSVQQ